MKSLFWSSSVAKFVRKVFPELRSNRNERSMDLRTEFIARIRTKFRKLAEALKGAAMLSCIAQIAQGVALSLAVSVMLDEVFVVVVLKHG